MPASPSDDGHPHRLTSTSVSDAMEKAGLGGALDGLTAYGDSVVVGAAFTVRLCGRDRSERPFNAYLDDLPEGCVVVVDPGALRGYSVWGGLMSAEARRRGAVGAVVRGEARDAAEAREMGFGVFALGLTPRSGRSLVRLEATNVPIVWGDVKIEPGDTVVADEDGVVVVPSSQASTILVAAGEIAASDAELLQRVSAGVPLSAAREELAAASAGPGR